MTAEEYLSWVRCVAPLCYIDCHIKLNSFFLLRFEASNLPDVVRANIDTSTLSNRQTPYMPKVDDIPPCPEICEPAPDWITSVISKFSDLRTVCNSKTISLMITLC